MRAPKKRTLARRRAGDDFLCRPRKTTLLKVRYGYFADIPAAMSFSMAASPGRLLFTGTLETPTARYEALSCNSLSASPLAHLMP